ncbi:40S ribosomal protein S25 [Mucor velutinosus]|uniref:Protein ARV n=1 Tax=Mucor velutinosus TaxID=708070 RepID=A0AAN7DLW5_9FUNG|nr:40S ribosomal protein S25 [Mucor velutinosus]
MDILPTELRCLIINHINRPADLGKCRLVCKAWNSFAEVAMLTAQIRIRTEFHAWKLYRYLKQKPHMAQHIKHLTIVATHPTETNGRAFLNLLSLAITPETEIVDGIVGLDVIYKKLIQLLRNSRHPIAKIKMLPMPINYNQIYMNAVLGFKHTLQELILNFNNIPIDWNLVYCLEEIEKLKSLTLVGDIYNITLTDTILKRCSNLTELDINVRFSDPIVLDKSSVHWWSSRNNVEKVHSMRALRFGAHVRSDLLEYLIYKFPRIQTVQLTTECGSSVVNLYTQYSKDNIRLTTCDQCNNFADKYIEHDFVIIFIDMLLHKPQVYRHLLFNRITEQDGVEPHVFRFAILLILFEVYIKWFRLERYYTDYDTKFIEQPLYYQYLYILTLCIFEFIVFHCCINLAIRVYFRNQNKRIRHNYVSMALIISSFGKMLLILMVIWDYKQLEYSWLVGIIVLASNTEALSVYLNIPYFQTLLIISIGILGRVFAQFLFLYLTYFNAQQDNAPFYLTKSRWISI